MVQPIKDMAALRLAMPPDSLKSADRDVGRYIF